MSVYEWLLMKNQRKGHSFMAAASKSYCSS
jgi:hypothetical protein